MTIEEVAVSNTGSEAGDAAQVAPPAAEPQTFEAMGLLPEVQQALTEMGFLDPLPVQRAVFPRMMAKRDILVQSRTGSGKTAAFGIPLAQGLIAPEQKVVQALALAPTRELALQVATECGRIGQYRGLSVVPIYGGAPMGKQVEQLKAGSQIVAGTPGRVLDHLRRGTLKLDALKVLILDEADEMLSMGFLEEITEIIRQCPPPGVRQTTLFSATIPEDIERIGSRYMRDPEKIQLSSDGVGAREIKHCYYMVSGMGRQKDLQRVLEVEQPESAIIFCNTREETNFVAEYLKRQGFDAEAISSDLTQKDRERVMGRTKEKNLHLLVATDIAARGIDISDLSHVINYTFPESAEVYVHRTGRTGRAGKSGTAISLISPRELGNFYMLKLTYKIKPEERTLPVPSSEQARAIVEGKQVDQLRNQLAGRTPAEDWVKVARRLWASEDGERLVALLVQDRLAPERRRASDPERVSAIPVRPEPRAVEARAERSGERTERSGERTERSGEPRSVERAARPVSAPSSGADSAPREASAQNGTAAAGGDSSRARPGYEERRARRARARRTGGDSGGGFDNPRPSRGERDRGPRGEGRGRGENGRHRAPEHRVSGTIDDSDGREFWEAWVDSKAEPQNGAHGHTSERAPVERASDSGSGDSGPGDSAASDSGAPAERESRRRREREAEPELKEGQVRLYLNLGRRDGLKETEIRALLEQKSVTVEDLSVRSSHTYLIVTEERADLVCTALHGGKSGERDIVCERARK